MTTLATLYTLIASAIAVARWNDTGQVTVSACMGAIWPLYSVFWLYGLALSGERK